MEFLLGLFTATVLFLLLFTAFYLGHRAGKKKHETVPMEEEEKRKIEAYNKHFKALFSYDIDKALERKKVK